MKYKYLNVINVVWFLYLIEYSVWMYIKYFEPNASAAVAVFVEIVDVKSFFVLLFIKKKKQ